MKLTSFSACQTLSSRSISGISTKPRRSWNRLLQRDSLTSVRCTYLGSLTRSSDDSTRSWICSAPFPPTLPCRTLRQKDWRPWPPGFKWVHCQIRLLSRNSFSCYCQTAEPLFLLSFTDVGICQQIAAQERIVCVQSFRLQNNVTLSDYSLFPWFPVGRNTLTILMFTKSICIVLSRRKKHLNFLIHCQIGVEMFSLESVLM